MSIISICNSRCHACHIWTENPASQKTDLGLEEYDRLFSQAPPSICWLSITGGEPFLRPDCGEILRLAAMRLRRLLLVSITTNGLDTERPIQVLRDLLRAFPSLRFYLNISLDGIGEHHDRLRGVPGNFHKALELAVKARSLSQEFRNRLKVCFETTFHRQNVAWLTAISALAKEQGVEHMLSPLQLSSYYKQVNKGSLGDKLKRLPIYRDSIQGAVTHYLKTSFQPFSLDTLIRRAFYKGILIFHQTGRHPVPCSAGKYSVVIDPKGKVLPCLNWNKEMGNLRKDFLTQILSDPSTAEVTGMVASEKCPGCWTPCEAIQSLLSTPWRMFRLSLASYLATKHQDRSEKRIGKRDYLPATT